MGLTKEWDISLFTAVFKIIANWTIRALLGTDGKNIHTPTSYCLTPQNSTGKGGTMNLCCVSITADQSWSQLTPVTNAESFNGKLLLIVSFATEDRCDWGFFLQLYRSVRMKTWNQSVKVVEPVFLKRCWWASGGFYYFIISITSNLGWI